MGLLERENGSCNVTTCTAPLARLHGHCSDPAVTLHSCVAYIDAEPSSIEAIHASSETRNDHMGGDTTLLEMSLARLEDIRRRGLEAPASQVVFAHSGAIDHDGVQGLVAVAEQFSLDREDAVSLRKRLVSVIVEGLENVHHHGLSECAQGSFAILLRVGDGYRFAFGNAVLVATAALLTHRVSVLNEMDEADLKEYYLKLLSNDARSERGGAGLGLMTMARKSSGPMATHSSELGNGQAFFSLELYVEPR